MAKPLSSRIGKEVIFGIRPEDIYDKLFVTEAEPDNTVSVKVEVVEPMGAEVYLHLNTEKHPFVARVGPRSTPELFKSIDVVFDMGKVHFFDSETEKTIV